MHNTQTDRHTNIVSYEIQCSYDSSLQTKKSKSLDNSIQNCI